MYPDRLFRTMHDCESSVRWKASVQNFEMNSLRWGANLQREVGDGAYRSKGFRRFDVTERGKLRHIQAVHISDRVVQKLLCRYALIPVIYPQLIHDNSACQEGKGTEFALKRLVEHLRWHLARYGKRGAVVTMDYRGFFGSIPHDGVIEALCMHQEDPRIRQLIASLINAFDGDRGLGLGSEISQIAAALYPTPVDKLAKERLRLHCYARFNDDSYFIHPDRDYALYCLEEIRKKAAELGLEVHRNKTKIHNLATDDFMFLKKRVHITDSGKVLLRITRTNIQREEHRIREQREEYDAGRIPLGAILQSYQCWRGYAQKYNSYAAVGHMDRFFLSVMGDAIRKEYGDAKINFRHPRPAPPEDSEPQTDGFFEEN